MPQLILHPWFFVFLLTWLSLLMLTPKKILSYMFLNSLTSPTLHQTFSPSWHWPWQ